MDAGTLLGSLAVGAVAGVLSGMFGVGGAVVTTPGIRLLGATPILAVGSTIPAILPGALAGTVRYARAGLVDWRIGLCCGGAGSVLAIAGAAVADVVDARWLMVLTAGLLAWSGVVVIRRARADAVGPTVEGRSATGGGAPAAGETEVAEVATEGRWGPVATRSTLTLAGIGALAGFVAGLLGVGGGVVMMPLFTTVLRLPARVAVASSLVAVAIFSVPAMVTHTVLGNIDWGFALPLVVGTVPGAWLGSRFTVGASERRMGLLLGGFFVAVAFLFGGRELVGLLG